MAITIKKGAITLKKPSVEQPPQGIETPPSAVPQDIPPTQEGVEPATETPMPVMVPAIPVQPATGSSHLVSLICGGVAIVTVIALIIFQLLENSGYRGYFPMTLPPAPQVSATANDLPELTQPPASASNEETAVSS